MLNIPKTIFCDIDGTLVYHDESFHPSPRSKMTALPGAIDQVRDWCRKGYIIILTTGRKESLREQTIKQLQEVGIPYDQLIMGVGRGVRVLINDKKPDGEEAALAINIDRNKGVSLLDV